MHRVLAILALLPLAAPAAAQGPFADLYCDRSEVLHRKLEQQFGETQQGLGMHGPDAVMELWSSPTSGNWTLVKRYATGRSCVVAMGESWADLAAPADPA